MLSLLRRMTLSSEIRKVNIIPGPRTWTDRSYHISPTSKDYINPMDINMDYSDDDNPLGVKSDFILSLCELIMGSRDGIEAEEKSVIDRCVPLVYQKYLCRSGTGKHAGPR